MKKIALTLTVLIMAQSARADIRLAQKLHADLNNQFNLSVKKSEEKPSVKRVTLGMAGGTAAGAMSIGLPFFLMSRRLDSGPRAAVTKAMFASGAAGGFVGAGLHANMREELGTGKSFLAASLAGAGITTGGFILFQIFSQGNFSGVGKVAFLGLFVGSISSFAGAIAQEAALKN